MQIGQTKEGTAIVGAADLVKEIRFRQARHEPDWHILLEITGGLEQAIAEIKAQGEELPPPPPPPKEMQQQPQRPLPLRRKNPPGVFDPEMSDDIREAVADARKAKQVQRAPPAQVAAPEPEEEDESDEELF